MGALSLGRKQGSLQLWFPWATSQGPEGWSCRAEPTLRMESHSGPHTKGTWVLPDIFEPVDQLTLKSSLPLSSLGLFELSFLLFLAESDLTDAAMPYVSSKPC